MPIGVCLKCKQHDAFCICDTATIEEAMKKYNQNQPDVLTEEVAELTTVTEKEMSIIVYNDDVTTFDTVIAALCEICKHDSIQAEQCANIIDTKGRCAVKNGSYKKLEPMCSALLDRGITAVIE